MKWLDEQVMTKDIPCEWCKSNNTEIIGQDWCGNITLCKDCSHEFITHFRQGETSPQSETFWKTVDKLTKGLKKSNVD